MYKKVTVSVAFTVLGITALCAQTTSDPSPVPTAAAPSLTAAAPAQVGSTDPADSSADAVPQMSSSDFLIDGTPYAKVLYLEGNVWIRPPGDTSFHRLVEDEPIAAQSAIYTGWNGVVDLAVGEGMAVRLVASSFMIVDELPNAPSASPTPTPSTPAAPQAAKLNLKKGTVFSALGREDHAPIDFEVTTPQGVAGARGTMFSTTTSEEGAQVNMLHGTVNFETPDHQSSQIVAGQSQRVSSSGGKFQLAQQKAMKPSHSEIFFKHAGGLLEHASGYGVVRRGLGPDVAQTLHEHGYKMSSATEQRFKNAAHTHYKNKPAFNRARLPHAAAGAGSHGAANKESHARENHPASSATNTHPAESKVTPKTTKTEESNATTRRSRREDDEEGRRKLGR